MLPHDPRSAELDPAARLWMDRGASGPQFAAEYAQHRVNREQIPNAPW